MQLTIGATAPDFNTTDFLGHPVNLQAMRGAPVLLSFYRYASCPVCNFRVHNVITAFGGFKSEVQQIDYAVVAAP